MGNELAVTAEAQVPAYLREELSRETFDEFSTGVQEGFPVLSYRGKTWRVRVSGEEQVYQNEKNEAIQSIEGVLIQAKPMLSKTYYKGQYVEGSSEEPDCRSTDGIRPDKDVINKVNALCASCPMNAWGSKVTEEGKKGRQCDDYRRTAFVMIHELEALSRGEIEEGELNVMLLRIPAASLKPLKEYTDRVLKPKGVAPYVVSTRIGFDNDVAYPKFTFNVERFLEETEFGAVKGLRDSEAVTRILSEAAEHASGGSTEDEREVASSEPDANAEASESAPPEASNTEEAHFQEPLQRAAAVEEASITTPPPKPAPKPKKTVVLKTTTPKSKPSATKTPTPSPAPQPESGADDFDQMLDNILG